MQYFQVLVTLQKVIVIICIIPVCYQYEMLFLFHQCKINFQYWYPLFISPVLSSQWKVFKVINIYPLQFLRPSSAVLFIKVVVVSSIIQFILAKSSVETVRLLPPTRHYHKQSYYLTTKYFSFQHDAEMQSSVAFNCQCVCAFESLQPWRF